MVEGFLTQVLEGLQGLGVQGQAFYGFQFKGLSLGVQGLGVKRFRGVRGQGVRGLWVYGISLRVQGFRGLGVWGLVQGFSGTGFKGFRCFSLGVQVFRCLGAQGLGGGCISVLRIWFDQFRGLWVWCLVVKMFKLQFKAKGFRDLGALGFSCFRGSGVQGLLLIQGLGFRAFGLWFRVQGLGLRQFRTRRGLVRSGPSQDRCWWLVLPLLALEARIQG